MTAPIPAPPSVSPKKPWYLRWWVWLIAAVVVVGVVSALLNPRGDGNAPGASQPSASETPAQPAPLDLEAFLTGSGVAFDSAQISASKAVIYVPTETSNQQAQQVADDAMRYICAYATEAGDKYPAANRVEVSDSVSIYTPGYNAADHPSGFATDEICRG